MPRTGALIAILVVLILPAALLAGEIWTLDGKTYSGAVRVEADGNFTVTPQVAAPVKIPRSNLAYAWFGSYDATAVASVKRLDVAMPQLQARGVGATKPGTLTPSGGMVILKGSGDSLLGAPDSFSMFTRDVEGDVELVARIQSVSTGGMAGLMIRSDIDPASAYAMVGVTAVGDVVFRARQANSGQMLEATGDRAAFPIWIRLLRKGSRVTWYTSLNGKNWEAGEGGTAMKPAAARAAEEKKTDFAKLLEKKPLQKKSRRPDPDLNLDDRTVVGLFVTGNGSGECRATFERFGIAEQRNSGRTQEPKTTGVTLINAQYEEGARGIWLIDGTFLPEATLASADKVQVRFVESGGHEMGLPLQQVARINLSPVPTRLMSSAPPDTSGVLLASGEYMEGAIDIAKNGRVTVNSITFGLSNFDLGTEAKSIMWHTPDERNSTFIVSARDGTTLAATALRAEGTDLIVSEPILGTRRIALKDITIIRAGAGRTTPLARLQPADVDGAPGQRIILGSGGDAAWGSTLTSNGRPSLFGVSASLGAEVTYELPPGAKHLIAWTAIPGASAFPAGAHFEIVIDDQPVVLAKPVRLIDGRENQILSVPISGRRLTIRVTSDKETDSVYGLWGDVLVTN